MEQKQKITKKALSHEAIYKIMQWLPPIVTAMFFLKNVIAGNKVAMGVIGLCLAAFVFILIFVKVRKVSLYKREFVLAIALPVLVFMISLFSGASFSDDFSLFLAVIALTGMYLEPQFTKVQIVEADLLLILMYLLHPEKTEGRSQYILCYAVFTLAAILFYLVIKRGRAFIEIGQERAEEAEKLLQSIRSMGAELQEDFAESSVRIELGTKGLQKGSATIIRGSGEVSENCSIVHEKISATEARIEQMNEGVKQFEEALTENRSNMEEMSEQVYSVSGIISESGEVFRNMEKSMKEIAGIAKQISDISFKLTILSLNASVEAAHAGDKGSGFEVLAAEMRELSENSGNFSEQASEVVKELLNSVEMTSERFSGSEAALKQSEETMHKLVGSFERLNRQFEALYDNIERQNENVSEIDMIFDTLKRKASDMHNSSIDNQNAVETIVEAMTVFSENVGRIVENTQSI